MSCFEKRPERWLPKGPVPENDAEPEVSFSQLDLRLPEQPWMPRVSEVSPFPPPLKIYDPEPVPAPAGLDPFGLDQHAPGAKLDNGKLRPGLVFSAFARALEAVAEVGTFGASKYSDNGWLQVPNGADRYTDALLRHYVAEAKGEWTDSESSLPHAAHLAWNALARLELMLREREKIKTSEQITRCLQK